MQTPVCSFSSWYEPPFPAPAPVVSSCLELIHTQEANENSLHLESLRPSYFEFEEKVLPWMRDFGCHFFYKQECLKFEALGEQRTAGLLRSCSLYQLIETLDEDLLCFLIDAARPNTNFCAVKNILRAIRCVFGDRSRSETHSNFCVATFGKLRRFLCTIFVQIRRGSVRISTSEYSAKAAIFD
jgi:hypothetical protein